MKNLLELKRMKYFIAISFSLTIFTTIYANEPVMLDCSTKDELSLKIDEVIDCSKNKYLELVADNIFNIELDNFNKKTVNNIMLDDVSNPNWLSQKGVYSLREHKLCLEIICDSIWNKCNTGTNQNLHLNQNHWCKETINNIFEIEKMKVKTATIENQRRKTRSTFREKFRAIEIRMHRYFIPNLITFTTEFQRFTDKITAFILNPL